MAALLFALRRCRYWRAGGVLARVSVRGGGGGGVEGRSCTTTGGAGSAALGGGEITRGSG